MHVSGRAGTRNGDYVVALGLEPGEGELTGSNFQFGGQSLQFFQLTQVMRQVVGTEARHAAAYIALRQLFVSRDGAGKKTSPQRAEGDKRRVGFTTGLKQGDFGIAGPQ